MKKLSTLVFSLSLFCTTGFGQLVANGYTNYNLNGFNVLVQNTALSPSRLSHTNAAIDVLNENLEEITSFCVAPAIIDSLKAVPIFMDWNTGEGIAQYHADLQWLIDNNYTQKKWKCVEISNVLNFVSSVELNQPYLVLHEMADAYNHRALNFSNTAIIDAYNSALANSLYTNVQFYIGDGHYATQANSLAITDQREFFAELTESYFGLNNYFPFDREDMETYDPIALEAIKSIWTSNIDAEVTVDGLIITSNDPEGPYQWVDCDHTNAAIPNATAQLFTATDNGNYAVMITKGECTEISRCVEISSIGVNDAIVANTLSAYPNPGNGTFTVTLSRQLSNMTLKLIDITGQLVRYDTNVHGNNFSLDITDQPNGIYLLEVGDNTDMYRTRLIKN